MSTRRSFLLPLSGVLLFSWLYADAGTPADELLSAAYLNQHAREYDGLNVVVRAFVTLRPGGHNLYESKELDAEFRRRWHHTDKGFRPIDYAPYCLTIENPDFLRADLIDGKTLVARGKFTAHYLGEGQIDLGACPLNTNLLIDAEDFKRRYPEFVSGRHSKAHAK